MYMNFICFDLISMLMYPGTDNGHLKKIELIHY